MKEECLKEIIVVITTKEENKEGKKFRVVSHGVNIKTLENVILPQVDIKCIGVIFNEEIGEFVLK
jgi:hypothetical protein